MIDFAALRAANVPLNAFVEWGDDPSVGAGALAGLTIGVKANIAVRGLAWTGGMEVHRARVAERDADAVARLRAAGASIIGITNMEEAALGAATRNPHYGWTHNPHALDRSAGGSSGGSGAAVAGGLCDAALGTDTMGSVRIPAAYCGVYGFKPANDRVSQDGLEVAEASLDCIGPLARSLDVLQQVAEVMSDFGSGDTGAVVALAGLGGVTCEPAVTAAYQRARTFVDAHREIALALPLSRVRFAGFVQVSKALAAHLSPLADTLSPHLRKLLTYGPRRGEGDWSEDRAILADVRRQIGALLADGTMLLLPTAPQTAFDDTTDPPANQADFTCLANIAGCAAVSIPTGTNLDGLPVAVQLLAAPGREAGLFAAARMLNAALDGYRRPAHFLKGEAR